ncbi:hypothetical protein [Chondromyces apiculatus]|uniref:Uncharacterized protein n=1 Tax=Chondromyces apiculatus DSM 436 TaxID=1192034 RepID=A0A017SZK8_9BACT|nr:hypothetical protein [Chondromyces apiculatus]EYF02192.1 Hypothetical protein CAP_7403 [Chondromyces apiculatus DSM 436]
MQGLRFDPAKAVTFDLENGLVHLEGAPARLLVPASALGVLCAAAGPEATLNFGRQLGRAMGRRLASRLGAAAPSAADEDPSAGFRPPVAAAEDRIQGVRAASLDTIVDHLGGEVALAGLGSLAIERWGEAMVMVLDQCPLDAEADRLLEGVLEGALQAACGRPARALCIDRDASRARFLIASSVALERVRAWLAAGSSWGEALVRLHSPPRGEA